jgi:hypothetical protein
MVQGLKREYFECSCCSDEHRLVFMLDEDTDFGPPDLYTSVFLHDYDNVFKRVWKAIKYVFGYKSKYGHFDCCIMKPEDAPRFQLLLQDYIETHNKWVKKLKESSKSEQE